MLEQIEDYSSNLEQKVEERTHKLSKSLKDLQQTQDQLVESEKLAALGGLVAGITHEINTPIGVGITAASTFNDHLQEIKKLYERGELTKTKLKSFLESGNYSNEIILSNLDRAADLVKSFKKVAVDQTNEEKRRFNVRSYVEDIVNSLKPTLKKTEIQVQLSGSDDLEINSYPGFLSQILTNLIFNSLVHAYPKHKQGTITISISKSEDHAILTYSDDGIGMNRDVISHIFEPFFTTNRGGGGTGLGLYIVYTIVTQNLNGSITCESEIGIGTTFSIRFRLS